MSAPVAGRVAPGYEPVADAFAHLFTDQREHGAAFAAFADGEPVVDLWGGNADTAAGRAWEETTLQLVFSGTKGLVATCLLVLAERGLLNPEMPVAALWPEFAARGKEAVTVAQAAAHLARLPAVRTSLADADLTDDRRLAALLAQQPQEHDERARTIYHALTHGWLCGELVRRADGRSVGRFFADEIAAPLGLELWIGLPAEHERRVATVRCGAGWGASRLHDPAAWACDPLLASVWANPPLFPGDALPWNTRAFHAAEIPAANAIGDARSLARLYGCLARGGTLGDRRLLDAATIADGTRERSRFSDPFTGEPHRFGLGFQLQAESRSFGPPADAFGHTGAGGSVHGAWPALRTGFSYAPNELRDEPAGDPRPRLLLDALHRCVAPAPPSASPATLRGGVA